jgi:TldD protein
MISDLDYGLYARKMGGGSVNPGTGDYSFAVEEGFLVKGGKILHPVKGATLIGKGIETLGRIEKVGNNLDLEGGLCGSISGWVRVTSGQPAILVSKLQVGGTAL